MGKGAYLVRFHLVGDWGFGQAGRSTIGICFLPISLRQIPLILNKKGGAMPRHLILNKKGGFPRNKRGGRPRPEQQASWGREP